MDPKEKGVDEEKWRDWICFRQLQKEGWELERCSGAHHSKRLCHHIFHTVIARRTSVEARRPTPQRTIPLLPHRLSRSLHKHQGGQDRSGLIPFSPALYFLPDVPEPLLHAPAAFGAYLAYQQRRTTAGPAARKQTSRSGHLSTPPAQTPDPKKAMHGAPGRHDSLNTHSCTSFFGPYSLN